MFRARRVLFDESLAPLNVRLDEVSLFLNLLPSLGYFFHCGQGQAERPFHYLRRSHLDRLVLLRQQGVQNTKYR